MLIPDELYRHGCAERRACSRYVLSDRTVSHALVQCPVLADLWSNVEQLLLCVGRIRLSAESTVMIVSLLSFNQADEAVFLCLVVVLKSTKHQLQTEEGLHRWRNYWITSFQHACISSAEVSTVIACYTRRTRARTFTCTRIYTYLHISTHTQMQNSRTHAQNTHIHTNAHAHTHIRARIYSIMTF